MKHHIFTFNGDLYAVQGCAVYHWHETSSGGYVSNIPRAHVSLHHGLKAYGMSRPLTDDELKTFGEAIEASRGVK